LAGPKEKFFGDGRRPVFAVDLAAPIMKKPPNGGGFF
jgi:hypothetical protein